MSLYIHVPYCEAKCGYCDFNSYAGREAEFEAYLEALQRDLRESAAAARQALGAPLRTIFIGGGTPSVLPPARLAAVLRTAHQEMGFAPDIEITSEANPGSLTPEFLERMQAAGLNRLSLGVQSTSDRDLQAIGRVHSRDTAFRAVEMARAAAVPSLSLDLIFGLPGQTVEDWEHTLREAVSLAPDHLSCYGLIIEEATAFGRLHAQGRLQVPDDDAQAAMYDATVAITAAAGYHQYEISNYARSGHECRHNMMYWSNGSYLGVGAGAVSYLGGWRYTRELRPSEYIRRLRNGESLIREAERVADPVRLAETIILGLRTRQGVRFDAAAACAPSLRLSPARLRHMLGELLFDFHQNGWIQADERCLRLSEDGVFLSNTVMERVLELPAYCLTKPESGATLKTDVI